MSELVTAARPYARAVFEFAQEAGSIDQWSEQILLMGAIAAEPSVSTLVEHPKMTKQQIAEVFTEVCGEKVDEHGANLIKLLAENGKLALLPEIAALYEQFKAEDEGLVEAEVVSAMELDADQENAIARSLKKRLGRDVKITTRIDESLMGGAIIRAGDLVIDGSLKGRLAKASTALSR